MDSQEIEFRQDSAMLLRSDLNVKKKLFKEARTKQLEAQRELTGVSTSMEQAVSRLTELKSGRGGVLATEGAVRVYEFWIELPEYSGPIRSATAQLTMHGSLQQVGNVSSNSKSGLGGGIVGGLLLGPLGAAVGVLATRKNEVRTRIQQVDTRQVELQITGPGYAWSTVAHYGSADRLRVFRDLINSIGSRTNSLAEAVSLQHRKVENINVRLIKADTTIKSADDTLRQRKNDCDTIWLEYTRARLPLTVDLKFRWQCMSSLLQWLIITCGPVLSVLWLGAFIYAIVLADVRLANYLVEFGVAHSALWLVTLGCYFYHTRL